VINIWVGVVLLLVVLLLDVLLAAARSAFVNCRISQLRTMMDEEVKGAELALKIATEATRLILSLRIGLSVVRIFGIGMPLILLSPLYVTGEGVSILVFTLVLIGAGLLIGSLEFMAERLIMRDPETWAIRLGPFVAVMEKLLFPIGWALHRVGGRISSPSGENRNPVVTEEEIMTLVDAGEEEGVIEEEEKAMIYSIFQLDQTLAREIMIPRIDLIAFEGNTSLREATDSLLRTGHSRAPVYSSSIDDVIGLIYIKDLLAAWKEDDLDRTVSELMREAYFVPEAKIVDDLLAEMRARRVHMVIVVDEYGGTAGLVTIEDIVEEIVGEILDEYDYLEELPYQQLQEGEYIFSGGIDLDDVNQITGANVPKEGSETLGGFIYSQLGKVPVPGEIVDAGGLHFVVEEVAGRRIRSIRAEKIESSETEKDTHDNSGTG
jgi:CBS domain containing-hemolysin-like protein